MSRKQKLQWEHDRGTGRRVYCKGRLVYGHVEQLGEGWLGSAFAGRRAKMCDTMTDAQRFVEREVRRSFEKEAER